MAKRKSPRRAALRQGQGSATSSHTPNFFEQLVPGLAAIAACWMLVAALELALSGLVSDTALRNDQLPLGARITLAAHALTVLVAGVGTIGGVLLLLSRLRRRSGHPAFQWTIGGVQAVV